MFINFNGDIVPTDTPLVGAENRGLRYGDGIFETMRLKEGLLRLSDFHFERLFDSLRLLQFDLPEYFTKQYLLGQVQALCERNGQWEAARVRLSVFRGDGGLFEKDKDLPNYLIHSTPLIPGRDTNREPLRLGFFPDARKAIDRFSNLKSNNFLIYVMAARYAMQAGLDDCFILNCQEMVCETTFANLFCLKDQVLYTPALSQGCVAGVMRRWLLGQFAKHSVPLVEQPISREFLQGCEEVFLSNAVQGILPVGFLEGRVLSQSNTHRLNKLLPDIC
jgi:branched-chain amino acid aminotransferase